MMDNLGETFIFTSIAFFVRLTIVHSSYQDTISKRVEISTPMNSWKRACEGLYLQTQGISPYEGDAFHEYPLSLYFYRAITAFFGQNVSYFFIIVDLFTAVLLRYAAYNQLRNIIKLEENIYEKYGNKQKKPETTDLECLKVTDSIASESSRLVFLVYLFSPATILPCIGLSTTVFTNALIAFINLIVTRGHSRFLTCFVGALISCNVLHYSAIIIPAILCIEQSRILNLARRRPKDSQQLSRPTSQRSKSGSSDNLYIDFKNDVIWDSIYASAILYFLSIAALIGTSYFLSGYSLDFISRTFLYTLKIADLSPNIGMCWYFFTEMFDHFQKFFLWVVQINAFIHVVPITIGLRKNAYFAMFIVLLISTVFQPYPSLANFGLITSLLPQWSYLFIYTKRGIISSCTMITCIALAPVLWHLWIVMGTANSNFYFGITLAFTTAQIILLADMLFAYSKRSLSLRQP